MVRNVIQTHGAKRWTTGQRPDGHVPDLEEVGVRWTFTTLFIDKTPPHLTGRLRSVMTSLVVTDPPPTGRAHHGHRP